MKKPFSTSAEPVIGPSLRISGGGSMLLCWKRAVPSGIEMTIIRPEQQERERLLPSLDKVIQGLLKAASARIEVFRVCCALNVLEFTGHFNVPIALADFVLQQQRADGGWSDILETAWALSLMKSEAIKPHESGAYQRGIHWMGIEKTSRGSWGRTSRDIPRIPVTGWVLTLLPELADEKSLSWLENEWKKDLNSETKLTYKGALTLMAFAATKSRPKDESLIQETVEYLMSEQNEDGGFSPWKGHPVGSEPWSTGIDLLGLTAYPDLVKPEAVERALDWLGRNQLSNGLWPCHYIEEGSAYCYWGAVEAMKYLKRIGRL